MNDSLGILLLVLKKPLREKIKSLPNFWTENAAREEIENVGVYAVSH